MIGIDSVVGAVSTVAGKLIDRLWPDPAQAQAAKLELLKMTQTGELAQLAADTDIAKGQLEVNKAEAGNVNWFVSCWRPAVGWVCVLGLAYSFLIRPLGTFGAHLAGIIVDAPALEIGSLMTLLLGMLGLGAARTIEKINGVSAK